MMSLAILSYLNFYHVSPRLVAIPEESNQIRGGSSDQAVKINHLEAAVEELKLQVERHIEEKGLLIKELEFS